MALASVVGIFGNIFSAFVFLAPIPTLRRIRTEGSTVGYDPIPYLVTFLACAVRVYYAIIRPNSTIILSSNAIGCALEAIYICVFLYYSNPHLRRYWGKFVIVIIAILAIIIIVTMTVIHTLMRWVVVGWINLLVSALVFASPIWSVVNVIRTGDFNLMSLSLSLCLTLNGATWFVYGALANLWVIGLPNGVGAVISAVQVLIYLTYRYVLPQQPEAQQSQPEAQQSQPGSEAQQPEAQQSQPEPEEEV